LPSLETACSFCATWWSTRITGTGLVRQPQSGMFGALSLVVAVAGAGLVASSPV
jgi:hypothetical protein